MGIALDVWVSLDGDCPVETEVTTTEVQMELGHSTGSLHLVMTEEALATVVEVAGEALRQLRAADESATVTSPEVTRR